MRFLLVLAFATVALAGAVLPVQNKIGFTVDDATEDHVLDLGENYGEMELDVDQEDESISDLNQREVILSWKLRRFLRKAKKQMPCGWPEYGIPPLAPVKLRETTVSIKSGILNTINEFFHLLFDGLDKFKIKKLKIYAISSKIKFDFIFPKIKGFLEKLDTNTTIDAMQQLGLSVQYEDDGSVKLDCKNIRLTGTLKYKIPVLWGSAKITSLKSEITVEKCTCNITGFFGADSIHHTANRLFENFVEKTINSNTQEISDFIEDTVVPKVNQQLKGHDFWTLLAYILSDSEDDNDVIVSKCVAPADPWA